MTIVFAIPCLALALLFLIILAWIDLKTMLLPNIYVGVFFILGVIFHGITAMAFTTIFDLVAGVIAGGGMLLLVRQIANTRYKIDTLGLGDVKLLAAAGVWLGLSDIFLAITIGAFAGLIHGALYKFYLQKKSGQYVKLSKLVIPAGPGFIIGIIIVGAMKFFPLLS